jgi:hypothetical protein
MRAVEKSPGRRRVRATLLALLWVWALVIFMVVDLFWNVEEFDRVRPEARWYRSARYVAHRMVGEEYRERDEFTASLDADVRHPLHARIVPRISTTLRVIGGVPPDHATSYRIQRQLHYFAHRTTNPEKRAAALRAIERLKALRQTAKEG